MSKKVRLYKFPKFIYVEKMYLSLAVDRHQQRGVEQGQQQQDHQQLGAGQGQQLGVEQHSI
jgi:hypothetical protein